MRQSVLWLEEPHVVGCRRSLDEVVKDDRSACRRQAHKRNVCAWEATRCYIVAVRWPTRPQVFRVATAALILSSTVRTLAQADAGVSLVVQTGRPLRVALSDTASIRRVGQPVHGTLTEPIYAYDRIVLPVGTEVR